MNTKATVPIPNSQAGPKLRIRDLPLYLLALAFIKFLQLLPLMWVARLGRALGSLAYRLDSRHRKVALKNLRRAFAAEKSDSEIESLAREHFRRLGENYCCAIKTAGMGPAGLRPHLESEGVDRLEKEIARNPKQNWVMAIGHFGNFELYARFSDFISGMQMATTYRGLRERALNKLMQSLRNRSGCLYFERRTDGAALRAAMANGQGIMLGLLSDQHAGDGGVWIPFFGEVCSTTTAPAVLALRYQCPLHTGFVFRTGLARWRVELGDYIETHENGLPRSTEAIMLDVNRSFERAIRRDPANWFWVHNRWKVKPPKVAPAPIAQTNAA